MRINNLRARSTLAVVAVACLSACGPSVETSATIQPEHDTSSGRLTKLSHDANGNGKLDTIAMMDGAKVVRVEVDEDENGTVDRWEYYTPSDRPGPNGQAPDV